MALRFLTSWTMEPGPAIQRLVAALPTTTCPSWVDTEFRLNSSSSTCNTKTLTELTACLGRVPAVSAISADSRPSVGATELGAATIRLRGTARRPTTTTITSEQQPIITTTNTPRCIRHRPRLADWRNLRHRRNRWNKECKDWP